MRTLLLTLATLAVVSVATGCGRHVVVDPETVASRNDTEWNIHSQPVPTATVQQAPPVAVVQTK
jgi:hypothetical protein